MTSDVNATAAALSRRHFLAKADLSGGAFLLKFALALKTSRAGAIENFSPNAFIRIDGDDRMTLTMPYAEMGQGVYTAIPMLIADGLEVGFDQIAQFKLIGKSAHRLDGAGKVDGFAIYSMDARPPSVKIDTLSQSPVFGGRLKNRDHTAAKAIEGGQQIVRVNDAVAVVADHMDAARKRLAALQLEWDDGSHATLTALHDAGEPDQATLRDRRHSLRSFPPYSDRCAA